MDFDQSREADGEIFKFSPPPRPVLIFFAVISAITVLATALTLAIRPVSYPLLAILLVTGGLVGKLCMMSVELMMSTRVRLNAEGLHIERLFGTSSHPWDVVEGVKLIPSIGSLTDDPNTEGKARLGLGLFIKGSKKERQHALDPDEVIITAPDTFERQLDRIVDTIGKFQARLGHGGQARSRLGGTATGTPAQFRRQPRAEAAAGGANYLPKRGRGGFGQRER